MPCLELIPPFLYSVINFPLSTGSHNSEPFQSSYKRIRISLKKKNSLLTSLPFQLFVPFAQGLSVLFVFLFSISSWVHFHSELRYSSSPATSTFSSTRVSSHALCYLTHQQQSWVAQLISPGNAFFTGLSGHRTPLSPFSYFPNHPFSSPLPTPSCHLT